MNTILFHKADLTLDTQPPLNREQSHHIANVLRLKPGARIRVLDGAGSSREAELTAVSKNNVSLA